MMRTLAICFGVFSLALPASTAHADWREVGPAPLSGGSTGRIAGVAPHPNNPDIIYIAGASGGVWRFDDSGWTPLTDRMPTTAMGAIALDPSAPDIVYAGSGESNQANHSFYGVGPYRSEDAGESWEILGEDEFAGRGFSRILVDPNDGKRIFAATMRAGDAKGHPRAGGPTGVFRSTDSGRTWAKLAGGLPDGQGGDLVFDPNDAQTLYANIIGSGLYRSTDSGDSWTHVEDIDGRLAIAVSPVDSQRIYVLSSEGSVHTSRDGGGSFTRSDPGISIQSYYDVAAGADPDDVDIAVFGGVQTVRTRDGGRSFSRNTPPHVDIHALLYDSRGRLLSGGDGGLHRSENNGDRWETLNEGLAIMQFYPGISVHPEDPEWFIGGLQDNGTARRREGQGQTWGSVLGADGGYTAVHPKDPRVVFAQYQGAANVFKSTDGGGNFSKSDSGINTSDANAFVPPIVFHPDDPQVVYYITDRLYRSDDQGRRWSDISGKVTDGNRACLRALAIAPSNPNTIYSASNAGNVFVSTDGGQNFAQVGEGFDGWRRATQEIAVAPWDDATALIGVRRFAVDQLQMTRDHGQTWTALDGDFPDVPVNSVALARVGEGLDIALAASDRGVWLNCGLTESWHLLGEGLPNVATTDIRYDANFSRVVLGTMGRGVWMFENATAERFTAICATDDDTGTSGDEGQDEETSGDESSASDGGSELESGDGDGDGADAEGSGSADGGDGDGDGDGDDVPGDEGKESSTTQGQQDATTGCGCRHSPSAPSPVWLLLVWRFVGGRRTRNPSLR